MKWRCHQTRVACQYPTHLCETVTLFFYPKPLNLIKDKGVIIRSNFATCLLTGQVGIYSWATPPRVCCWQFEEQIVFPDRKINFWELSCQMLGSSAAAGRPTAADKLSYNATPAILSSSQWFHRRLVTRLVRCIDCDVCFNSCFRSPFGALSREHFHESHSRF
jgi:hypothetical protein